MHISINAANLGRINDGESSIMLQNNRAGDGVDGIDLSFKRLVIRCGDLNCRHEILWMKGNEEEKNGLMDE